jgi:hypothetical protein
VLMAQDSGPLCKQSKKATGTKGTGFGVCRPGFESESYHSLTSNWHLLSKPIKWGMRRTPFQGKWELIRSAMTALSTGTGTLGPQLLQLLLGSEAWSYLIPETAKFH